MEIKIKDFLSVFILLYNPFYSFICFAKMTMNTSNSEKNLFSL